MLSYKFYEEKNNNMQMHILLLHNLVMSVHLSPSQYDADTHSEQLLRQISSLVDAPIHEYEPFHRGLVSDIRVVQAGVEHDDGERENIACVCGEQKLGSVSQLCRSRLAN